MNNCIKSRKINVVKIITYFETIVNEFISQLLRLVKVLGKGAGGITEKLSERSNPSGYPVQAENFHPYG